MVILRFEMRQDFLTIQEIPFELECIAAQIRAGRIEGETDVLGEKRWEIWKLVNSADD